MTYSSPDAPYQLLPPLRRDEYDLLRASIAESGVLVPVEQDENGVLLDGHHRMRAMRELRAEGHDVPDPPVIVRVGLSEAEKRSHVRALNLNRRHLSAAQRRAIIEEQLSDTPERSDRSIAHELNVSPTTVGMVRRRLGERASASVQNGQSRMGRDGRMRRLPAPRAIIASDGVQARRAVAAMAIVPPEALPERVVTATDASIAARIVRRESAREARFDRLRDPGDLAGRGRGRFTVLYADPPWAFSGASDETRRAEQFYPTMSHKELMELPVGTTAARDAVLFLWAPAPKLAEAMELIAAWGFSYVTSAVWSKGRTGMGSWYRLSHEHLLIATRGSIPAPAPAVRPDSVIQSPRGAHSVKPAVVRKQIEAMYPGLSRIELFARGPVPGWSVWGFEAEATAQQLQGAG